MRCYTWGTNNSENRDQANNGVVSFAIPDLGIQFRAAYRGTAVECEYLALMALLNFAVTNPKLFERQKLDIFTDAVLPVYQVNRKAPVPTSAERYIRMIQRFRTSHQLTLGWVHKEQNPAFTGVLDLPPLKTKSKIALNTPDTSVGQAKPAPSNFKF
ncbi:MAG: hypothetical protein HZB43_00240 [candidate division Zixibacteria bacterium]|nr:hypothetical protein [candidate division Zixibacteria bacterium]